MVVGMGSARPWSGWIGVLAESGVRRAVGGVWWEEELCCEQHVGKASRGALRSFGFRVFGSGQREMGWAEVRKKSVRPNWDAADILTTWF